MTVRKERRGEQEKCAGGPNTNMPRWAHWRWRENVYLEGGVGVEDKQPNTTNVPIWVL